jgi:sulfoxide reductase heme-binding subunit YedZ
VTTSATPHLFWITSRAAGIVALVLASLAVSTGLLMSTKLLKKRGPDLLAAHEVLSLSTIVAITVHGVALLGDQYLRPSIADISIPLVSSYKTAWTALGIVGGWGLALLGLSYYARRRIGAARWRALHRLTALMWLAGLVHALGEGTDAGQAWFLAMIGLVVVPALVLLSARMLGLRGSGSGPQTSFLQTGRVANHHVRKLAAALRPAGAALGERDRVKAPTRHLHPDVAGVGIDRDPAAGTRVAPVLEVARDHRRADQPGGRERVAH